MRCTTTALFVGLACSAAAYAANAAETGTIGRYQLGGTERDGLMLIDTATGRTWKYDRGIKAPYSDPVWIPLRFPGEATSAPAAKSSGPQATPQGPPQTASDVERKEQPWFVPGPYRDKRPGGK